ncbi:MAG: CmpA/NrtA family ABC transporter substrate-binding protein [Pseudoruegeria sp.]
MKVSLNIGYIPLVDCAPLVIAHELGFAEREGLTLNLIKHPSWSAIRDMVALGHLDAAHMLSPMPVAMSLGLGGLPVPLDALMVLSINGNNIGVSAAIADRMRIQGWDGNFQTPYDTGQHLIKATNGTLRLGVPYPFAMHTELTSHWLGTLGLNVKQGLNLRIIPPQKMADAVAADEIDAFCVGEPWGSIAVENSVAELVLPGSAIWSFAPEKVLATRQQWSVENPELTRQLMRATHAASHWLCQKSNKMVAAEILARPAYLNLSSSVIDRALTGNIRTRTGQISTNVDNFLLFHTAAANFPWRSQGAWIASRIAAREGIDQQAALAAGRACFRSDLYREYLNGTGADLPGASEKVEGALSQATPVPSVRGEMILGPDAFFDGQVFDFGR